MTNKKSTKRALLSSVLALVLCLTMLIGTTFAWFTDSVTSGKNQIVAGNLDIELEYSNDMENWKTVKDSSEIFKPGALWEPGYTEVVYLRLTNKGTLDLKYQFGMNIYSEKLGVNQAGETFKLSDYIEFGVQESVTEKYADSAAARAAVTDAKIISAGYSKTGAMEAGTDAKYMALVVYMPETVGNVANHNGETIPEIELGLNVVATQLASEFDSFDNQYDAEAIYYDVIVTTYAELKEAIAAGYKTIAVDGMITLEDSLSGSGLTLVGFDKESGIAFDAKNISSDSIVYKNLMLATHERSDSVSDIPAGTWYGGIDYHNVKKSTYINCTFNSFVTTYADEVNFIDCTFYENVKMYSIYVYDSIITNIEGCTFYYSDRAIKMFHDGGQADQTVNINDCTFLAGSNFVANKALVEIDDANHTKLTVNINDSVVDSSLAELGMYKINDGNGATKDVTVNVDGTIVSTSVTVNDADTLKSALTGAGAAGAGNTVVTFSGDDIDLSGETWTPVTVDGYHGADIITIDGNGATITGLSAPLFAGGFAGGSGIVIKNLTIANSDVVSTNTIGSGAFIESVDSMDVITLENCHLLNSTVTGGDGSRTGGLIGWTAGYNNVNDGPVKTYVTIKNCSVIGCTITCNGSVGAIYGHAGNNAWTYSTVEDCIVKDNKLNSTDDGDWRVGVVVGTANVGEMTINNITQSGNTLTQTGKTAPEGQSNLYGRFVPGTTGKLTIDGVAVQQ